MLFRSTKKTGEAEKSRVGRKGKEREKKIDIKLSACVSVCACTLKLRLMLRGGWRFAAVCCCHWCHCMGLCCCFYCNSPPSLPIHVGGARISCVVHFSLFLLSNASKLLKLIWPWGERINTIVQNIGVGHHLPWQHFFHEMCTKTTQNSCPSKTIKFFFGKLSISNEIFPFWSV